MHDIVYLPISAILPRENSQRKEYREIDSLADSLTRIGFLHPIVVDQDNRLVAGGRRLEAAKKAGFLEVPTTKRDNLDDATRRVLELEENVKRLNLKWQEEAVAIAEIDEVLAAAYPDKGRSYHADYVGYAHQWYLGLLRLGKAVNENHTRVIAAPTATAALNILYRESERNKDNDFNAVYNVLLSEDEAEELNEAVAELPAGNIERIGPAPKAEIKSLKAPKAISQGDMLEWMPQYSGPKFNLIHCDFPYGINHGKSDQGGAKDRWESYEDSPEIYWTLVRCLLNCRDQIMLPSCHIIFWLSARFSMEEDTRKMFASLAPELDIDEYNLIWHKTDNKGIIRNVDHTPRNIYEKALFITRGQRKIIKAVGNVYGAPTQKSSALHISEKPVPVLKHFMQLCVDGHTELLDPTCGGGSAIRAAHSMGARRVIGRELNPDYAEGAQKEFEEQLAIENLRKKGD